MSNQQIRKHIRQQRRALSQEQREQLSLQFSDRFTKSKLYRNCQHIAVYMAADGEMDLTPVIHHAWSMGKTIYLPVLNAPHQQSLFFAPYHENDPLDLNRYGIAEPRVAANKRVKAQKLDVVLTPLVAFDKQGSRIGMGAGYYDRTFSYLLYRRNWFKPKLVGVAYSFQQVDDIKKQAWDVSLHYISTEFGMSIC